MPADAFAYLAFHDYGHYLEQALNGSGSAQQLRQFQRETGLSLNARSDNHPPSRPR